MEKKRCLLREHSAVSAMWYVQLSGQDRKSGFDTIVGKFCVIKPQFTMVRLLHDQEIESGTALMQLVRWPEVVSWDSESVDLSFG
ncbi:hypothetical protein Nepgr_000873 [Nepenthes gracilis]|uniref:Uncharacterized protein n=1 Tax=Nepenthes gracilis TaxID=150966 RepID=A0AAD3P773_NEPGR|nr:hypothetical protein Nepgr_000873 [Nepenthes gracilis]